MSKNEKKISSAPLFKRLGKGGAAKFAGKLIVSEQVLSNWKRRGIPAAEVGRVAAALGISYEQYMLEAGKPVNMAKQPEGQYTIEAATLLEDFNALPEWLKEHIARKTSELRKYADSLPKMMRDGMRGPPKDPASYRAWEKGIEDDIAAKRGKVGK